MLRQASARPEQCLIPNNLTSLINGALHAAAVAPSLADALDITGAALCSVADLARHEQPAVAAENDDQRFRVARDTADSTMNVLDRLASICEAIGRCARDVDMTVEDLAGVAREMARAESDRLDRVFTMLAHRSISTEVRHG